MNHIYQKFLEDAESKSFDKEHRKRLNYNLGKYDAQVEKGKYQYQNLVRLLKKPYPCKMVMLYTV